MTAPVKLTIDPATLSLLPKFRDGLTTAEFAALVPPECPVCGEQVTVQRIDVTPDAEWHAQHGRLYIVGMWECPHHCDPRTGQRVHFGQSYRSSMAIGGVEATCSCGDVTVCAGDELAVWQETHKPPTVARRETGTP
jgi:hypothetical protein